MQTIGDLIDQLIDVSVQHFNGTTYSRDAIKSKFLKLNGARKYYYRVLEPIKERKQNDKIILPKLTSAEYKILTYIGEEHNISLAELVSKSRKREIVEARMQGMVIFYVYLFYTFKRTGDLFTKDHSTVIHAIETTNDLFDSSPGFQRSFIRTLSRLTREMPELFSSYQKDQVEYKFLFANRKNTASLNTRLGHKSYLEEIEDQKQNIKNNLEKREEAY